MAHFSSNRPVALITGASSGIGKALAENFAENGYDVILAARSVERMEAHAADLEKRFSIAAPGANGCASALPVKPLRPKCSIQTLQRSNPPTLRNRGYAVDWKWSGASCYLFNPIEQRIANRLSINRPPVGSLDP